MRADRGGYQGNKNMYPAHAKQSVYGENTEEITRRQFQTLQEGKKKERRVRTLPVPPPQPRMLYLSSAAT